MAIVVPSGTPMTDAILKPAPTHAKTIGRLSIGVIILTNKLINEIMVPATAAVIIRANRSQPSVGAIAVKVLPIKKTVINSIRSLYRFQLLVKVVIIGVLIA